ncbi:sigma-70 family RNA polymerase sigma factor [Synechococcus sp. PCC 7336]|uniref:sigma-70 family RNA polymerase sigma factor n=1 Tax=Synechococcus sp. PCC 7336 TaxID=195250 RepID=UPI000344A1B0|nr:sigma-70 family RNA polymerase sigma factor [Synechococcus sp. PCC 7336]
MSEAYPLNWSTSATASVEPIQPEQLVTSELIAMCQSTLRPHRGAFAELIRRHQRDVDRILYHLAPDWTDRHDLAQEVWLRVFRNLRRLKEPAKFRGWLGRIATNLFYDELRKRKRYQRPLSLDAPITVQDGAMEWELPSEAIGPEEVLSAQEFYEHLHHAVQLLPEAFRQTIVLREIQGLSYDEIAEITGVSLGTVKSRIARARGRLQTMLKPYLEGH